MHFFTKENITFALSIFGSLNVILIWFHTASVNRTKINCKLSRYDWINNLLVVYLVISNESRLPISINNIDLIQENDQKIRCECYPQIIVSRTNETNGLLKNKVDTYSVSMPINIGAMSSYGGFFVFASSQAEHLQISNELTFSISTNRGKPIQMKLLLTSAPRIL